MKGTLWAAEGRDLHRDLDAYTVGQDRVLDQRLLRWDVLGTIGHVEGLAVAGLLSDRERSRLVSTLRRALRAVDGGKLVVGPDDEDCHSLIEKHLIARLGSLGEKVHTGRSRNDQVVCAMRLWLKDRLLDVAGQVVAVAEALLAMARAHRGVLLPGFTHQRRAMPSTVGLWAAGFAEALIDDLLPLSTALDLVDRSPLGSAAGYGVPLPLDRSHVARVLGFGGIQTVVTAVQVSRGKIETLVISALWAVAFDLGKLASDIMLLSDEDRGYLALPEELLTGSSIMPHKKNPDVFELTRARAAVVDGLLVQSMAIGGKLPSGYHRDMQLGKGPVMAAVDVVLEMLHMTAYAVPRLVFDRQRCAAAVRGTLLATDEVFRRVRQGETFRKAYRQVAAEIRTGADYPKPSAAEIIANRSHAGGAGSLGLGTLQKALTRHHRDFTKRRTAFAAALHELAGKKGGRA